MATDTSIEISVLMDGDGFKTNTVNRQAALDEQIEAFLAKGGEIKAFDTLRRPVESTPWSKFSLTGSNPPISAAPRVLKPRKKVEQVPVSAAPAAAPAVLVEPIPTPNTKPAKPTRQPLRADDEKLAVKIIVAAALGGAPRGIASELHIPLKRCLAIAEQFHVQFHA